MVGLYFIFGRLGDAKRGEYHRSAHGGFSVSRTMAFPYYFPAPASMLRALCKAFENLSTDFTVSASAYLWMCMRFSAIPMLLPSVNVIPLLSCYSLELSPPFAFVVVYEVYE